MTEKGECRKSYLLDITTCLHCRPTPLVNKDNVLLDCLHSICQDCSQTIKECAVCGDLNQRFHKLLRQKQCQLSTSGRLLNPINVDFFYPLQCVNKICYPTQNLECICRPCAVESEDLVFCIECGVGSFWCPEHLQTVHKTLFSHNGDIHQTFSVNPELIDQAVFTWLEAKGYKKNTSETLRLFRKDLKRISERNKRVLDYTIGIRNDIDLERAEVEKNIMDSFEKMLHDLIEKRNNALEKVKKHFDNELARFEKQKELIDLKMELQQRFFTLTSCLKYCSHEKQEQFVSYVDSNAPLERVIIKRHKLPEYDLSDLHTMLREINDSITNFTVLGEKKSNTKIIFGSNLKSYYFNPKGNANSAMLEETIPYYSKTYNSFYIYISANSEHTRIDQHITLKVNNIRVNRSRLDFPFLASKNVYHNNSLPFPECISNLDYTKTSKFTYSLYISSIPANAVKYNHLKWRLKKTSKPPKTQLLYTEEPVSQIAKLNNSIFGISHHKNEIMKFNLPRGHNTPHDRMINESIKINVQKSFGYGQLVKPVDICCFHNELYISDKEQNSIIVYGNNGDFIQRIGNYGTDVGQFNIPLGLSADYNNNALVIADNGNNRIQLCYLENCKCEVLNIIGKNISSPLDVKIGSYNKYYILDNEHNISIVGPNGTFETCINLFQLFSFNILNFCVNSKGTLFVFNENTYKVFAIHPIENDKLIIDEAKLHSTNAGAQIINAVPHGLLMHDNNLYVLGCVM